MKFIIILLSLTTSFTALAGTRVGDDHEGYVCDLNDSDLKEMKELAKTQGAKSLSILSPESSTYTVRGKEFVKTFFTFENAEGELVFADYIMFADTCASSGISYGASSKFEID